MLRDKRRSSESETVPDDVILPLVEHGCALLNAAACFHSSTTPTRLTTQVEQALSRFATRPVDNFELDLC